MHEEGAGAGMEGDLKVEDIEDGGDFEMTNGESLMR